MLEQEGFGGRGEGGGEGEYLGLDMDLGIPVSSMPRCSPRCNMSEVDHNSSVALKSKPQELVILCYYH